MQIEPPPVALPARLFHCQKCGKPVQAPVDKDGAPLARPQCDGCRVDSIARYCRLPGDPVDRGRLPAGLCSLIHTCHNYAAGGRCLWQAECLVLAGLRCRLFEMTVCPPLAIHPEAWGTVGDYMAVHGIGALAADPKGPRIRICPTCRKRPIPKRGQRCAACLAAIRRVAVRVAVRKNRKGKKHARA